jgi:aspartate carbamoyltransferase catalytic subunit
LLSPLAASAPGELRGRDLLTLEGVERPWLRGLMELAHDAAEGRLYGALAGKTVCLAFYEASTRTAASFELAARRAGADVVSISERGSSVEKGESLLDTVMTLEALGADAIVVRHPAAGAARLAASHARAAILNAGDGRGQHPTQALLDLFALSNALGGFDELAGRKLAVVGDVLHSRVARSVVPAFLAAGLDLALVAPPTLLPEGALGLPTLPSVDAALDWGAEALYALRLQKERMAGGSPRVPSVAEYARFYGVSARHLAGGALVMHPGPVNRGVEISGDAVLHRNSLVLDQVASGLPVRTAALALATGVVTERLAA